jgi:hypothetical protein
MTRSVAVSALLCAAAAATAGGPVTELDCGANTRLLDSHFARYGYLPTRSIIRDNAGIRIWLPTATPGVGQTGLYSYFAVAGDFEFSANYELLDLPPPQGGYGASVAIVVDSQGPGGSVTLARGQAPQQSPGYLVTRGLPGDVGPTYETNHYPSTAKAGRLVLRRAKAEVTCLVSDGPAAELRELCRLPFVPDTVRQVRLYGDAGGSRTAVDARLTRIKLTATEIAGGAPVFEPPQSHWLLWAGGGGVAAAGALLAVQKRRRRWPWRDDAG